MSLTIVTSGQQITSSQVAAAIAASEVAYSSVGALPSASSVPANTVYSVLVPTAGGYNEARYAAISGAWVQVL